MNQVIYAFSHIHILCDLYQGTVNTDSLTGKDTIHSNTASLSPSPSTSTFASPALLSATTIYTSSLSKSSRSISRTLAGPSSITIGPSSTTTTTGPSSCSKLSIPWPISYVNGLETQRQCLIMLILTFATDSLFMMNIQQMTRKLIDIEEDKKERELVEWEREIERDELLAKEKERLEDEEEQRGGTRVDQGERSKRLRQRQSRRAQLLQAQGQMKSRKSMRARVPQPTPLSIQEMLFQVISSMQLKYTSFGKYVHNIAQKVIAAQNPYLTDDTIGGSTKGKNSMDTRYESKLVEDQLLVTDLLVELTRPHVEKIDRWWKDRGNSASGTRGVGSGTGGVGTTGTGGNTVSTKQQILRYISRDCPTSSHSPASLTMSSLAGSCLTTLTNTHYEICASIAKSLNIYELTLSEDVLPGMCGVMIAMMKMRYRISTYIPNTSPLACSMYEQPLHYGNPLLALNPLLRDTMIIHSTTSMNVNDNNKESFPLSPSPNSPSSSSAAPGQCWPATAPVPSIAVMLRPVLGLAPINTGEKDILTEGGLEILSLSQHIDLWDEISGKPLNEKKSVMTETENRESMTESATESMRELDEVEVLVGEIIGLPLALPYLFPSSTLSTSTSTQLAIVQCQTMIESLKCLLYDFGQAEETLLREQANRASLDPSLQTSNRLADSVALRSLQRSLHDELWGGTALGLKDSVEDGLNKATLTESKVSPQNTSTSTPHLIAETDKLMHRQRIDQVTAYLDILNQRAVKKKKLLKALLSLWDNTKSVLKHSENVEREREMNGEKGGKEGSSKVGNLMSVQEIVDQTRSIQNLLLKDMQTNVSIKTSSVSHCML